MKFIKSRIGDWLIGVAIAVVIISMIGCDCSTPPNAPSPQPEGFGMSTPEHAPNSLGRIHVSPLSNVVAMRTSSTGHMETVGPLMRIVWRGDKPYGATTLDSVNATIGRMEWEQKDPSFASDTNAQAMFHLMQARQLLEGKTITTEDGLPIIE